jgi:FAD/FMN-containing dehydrogenase
MPDLNQFLSAIGDVPSVSDPVAVRRKSRDMTAQFSPIMRDEMKGKFADVIVRPRSKEDVLKVASAAARVRMPLMMRGGGTGTFGQGIPLNGGAVVDMTGLKSVLWVKGGSVRAEAGARLFAIDEATRPAGWELRMHSSTKRHAAIGGFVGGGHAGVGSCVYGILRDRGNILGLQVVSVEEEPTMIELRGDDVNLVHHAYGANGIMTEVEMPLAPAWAWTEVIVVFREFMRSVEFSHTLATSDGIVKKLVSIIGWPIPSFMRALRPYVHDGSNVVLCMAAAPFMDAVRALVKDFSGEITSEAPEGEGPYGIPIYEFSWGHTRMHANK